MGAYSTATCGLAGRKVPQGVLATCGLAGRKIPQGTLTPIGVFSASEPGAFYDPSDLSTLFQDSAGSTPVTAVEQPVGRMLDKSGRGNHTSQATTTKRPVYSRRVNLYPNSTFTGGVSGSPGTVPSGLTYFLNGTTTFTYSPDVVRIETPAGARGQLGYVYTVSSNTTYIFKVKVNVRSADVFWQHFIIFVPPAGTTLRYFVDGVEVTGTTKLPTGIHDLECRAAIGANAGTVNLRIGNGIQGNMPSAGDIEFTQPSFTLATDAHLPYQWVNTATDYDADPSKFPAYLRFDGVDDALQTGNIDFTGIDKMTVWAGINSDKAQNGSALGTILLHPDTGLSSFVMYAPSGSQNLSFAVATSSAITSAGTSTTVAVNNNAIVIGIGDLATRSATLRVNGANLQTSVAASGGGNFRSGPLYIGGQATANRHFSGRLYGLIVRGAQSSLSQIEATELYIKQKMRMP